MLRGWAKVVIESPIVDHIDSKIVVQRITLEGPHFYDCTKRCWSNTHKKMRPRFLVTSSSYPPARANDSEEEEPEEEPSLFTIVNLNRVQMKMVLWSNIIVESGVHILKMMSSSVWNHRVCFWIRFVETAASGCSHHHWLASSIEESLSLSKGRPE